MKIYLASSWRNPNQDIILRLLREAGFEVYDFKNPAPGNEGFSWKDAGGFNPKSFSHAKFLQVLKHPISEAGYACDWSAMQAADAAVLLLPCGRSAHLEAGYFVGAGKPLYILGEILEPELMYKMATGIFEYPYELMEALGE